MIWRSMKLVQSVGNQTIPVYRGRHYFKWVAHAIKTNIILKKSISRCQLIHFIRRPVEILPNSFQINYARKQKSLSSCLIGSRSQILENTSFLKSWKHLTQSSMYWTKKWWRRRRSIGNRIKWISSCLLESDRPSRNCVTQESPTT